MRILIAEDERITRRKLHRQLEQWGHEVVAAANGHEAWEYFQATPFPIVISDWEMPIMNGVDLVRQIRAANTLGYVYFILLTAKSQKQDIVIGMEAGADDFVSKPFDRNELRVRLRAGQRIIDLERNLAQHNERMQRDLQAAAELQQSLLPTTLTDVNELQCAWSFVPCDELAGDFLNIFKLDENHIAAFVIDVSGHGVASSLLSVAIGRLMTPRISSSSLLVQKLPGSDSIQIIEPAEVAYELNRRFPMEDQNGLYFTMLYGVLNLESLEFKFVSAGHDPMVLSRANNKPEMIRTESLAIGWMDNVEFENHVIKLESGNRLYLYSDGVPEAMDQELNQFGTKKMLDVMEQGQSSTLSESVSLLSRSVVNWCGANGPRDDVSILGIEIR